MAIVQSSFSSYVNLDTAYKGLSNAVSLENAISWGVLAYDNVENGQYSSVDTFTPTLVEGTSSLGDYIWAYGTNLHVYPNITNQIDYYFTSRDVFVTLKGEVTTASQSAQPTGYVNEISYYSPDYGGVSINGYDNVSLIDDGTVESAGYSIGTVGAAIIGNLNPITRVFGNTYQTAITGTIDTLHLSDQGQSITLIFDTLDYQAYNSVAQQSQSVDSMLSFLLAGDDQIIGSDGSDYLFGYGGDDYIDAGAGIDTVALNISSDEVTEFRSNKSGGISISSTEGTDTLIGVEKLSFTNGEFTISDLLTIRKPNFIYQGADGATTNISPEVYSGPVGYLEYELIGGDHGEVYYGSSSNDFINLKAGDDAANGGLGDDVLDGGTGSNFLIGGGGNDTFFLDGRSGSVTWSTVTDFSSDEVNIWGWLDGVSKVVATDSSAGAEGFKGATFHYDLNNDGIIDTSITFSGLSIDDVPDSQALSVEGNGYLLIA